MAISEKHARRIQYADYLLDCLILILLFAVGICRYRSVLVLALIMFLRFIITLDNIKFLTTMLAPLLIVALIADVKMGQFYPIFPELSPFISVLSYLITEFIVVEYLKSRTYTLSGNKVFAVCPRCFYNNGYLVPVCGICKFNYEKYSNDLVSNSKKLLSGDTEGRTSQVECKLPKNLSSRKKVALNLDPSESILASVRIAPFRGLYKNDLKLIISHMIITDCRIIIIRFGGIAGGWKAREDLKIKDIESFDIENKLHHGRQVRFIVFKLNDDLYEMFYSAGDTVVLNEIYKCINSRREHPSAREISTVM